MTASAPTLSSSGSQPGSVAVGTRSRGAAARSAFWALMLRDLAVLDRRIHIFLARTIVQPLLIIFVFANVFPNIHQGVGGASGASTFTSTLVPGIIALSIVINGVQAVAVNLMAELGFNREIEDRVLAPIGVSMVAVQKIIFGAMEGLFAGMVVFPIAAVIPSTPLYLHVNWLLLATIAPLVCITSAALGLALGTLLEPRSVTFLFSIVLLPLTMLGGLYYPWSELSPIPWLKIAVLVNPLIYMSEGMRAALVNHVPHMPVPYVYLGLAVFTVGFALLGIRGFRRRVLS
jgi:ABC-2 type transport system permease protein